MKPDQMETAVQLVGTMVISIGIAIYFGITVHWAAGVVVWSVAVANFLAGHALASWWWHRLIREQFVSGLEVIHEILGRRADAKQPPPADR